MSDSSQLQLIKIWLLASQTENRLPCDEVWLKKQIGVNNPVNLKPLFDKCFIELIPHASTGSEGMIATCKQGVEGDGGTETETYKPTETETYIRWFDEDWLAYPRKAGSKSKAKSAYLKSVTTPEKRKQFQDKTRAYLESCRDPKYYKQGETWFRGWEDHVIDELETSSVESNISVLKELEARG